jgi:YYY domain-containing protein
MEYLLIARWVLVYVVLFLLTAPITARLSRHISGYGVGFALPLGFVIFSVPAYWVGQWRWGPLAYLVGLGTLLTLSSIALCEWEPLRDLRVDRHPASRIDGIYLIELFSVFLLGFGCILLIRSYDPGVIPVGGEKFLDFGLLQTLSRSAVLPPMDFWFAGERVQYYYGGHLTTTILGWLTSTPPPYAYNLSLAGFFGALLAAVYELAGLIWATAGGNRRLAGGLAVYFVGWASNLYTPTRLTLQVLPTSIQRPIINTVASQTGVSSSELRDTSSSFYYWDASRVIEGTINEFPLFAWLNGDLHAHMLGQPILVLAMAVGFIYYCTPPDNRRDRQVLIFVIIPVVAGWQAIQNTWSFPSVLAIGVLTVFFAPSAPRSLFRTPASTPQSSAQSQGSFFDVLRRMSWVGVVAVCITIIAVIVALPFVSGPATGGGSRSLALLPPSMRSSLGAFLLVHGLFMLILWTLLFRESRWVFVCIAAAGAILGSLLSIPAAVAVVPLLVGSGWMVWTRREFGYMGVLLIGGTGLLLLVELVYVNEQAGPGRMNTVFKTYAQVWLFLAISSGVALSKIRRRLTSTRWTQTLGVIIIVGVVILSGLYGGFAVGAHLDSGPPPGGPTLDATAFVDQRHPESAEAIEWIDQRPGQPVLLEAPGTTRYGVSDTRSRAMYSWSGNPASSLTGVPTVAGWAHEVGYRGQDAYRARVTDVDTMYTGTTGERARLLHKYNVSYIWVGPSEKARYEQLNMSMDGVRLAHQSGAVRIYSVSTASLPRSASAG